MVACAISEMGKLFARVRKYTENPGADGRVQQALTAALKDQLTQYYRLIAVLEQQWFEFTCCVWFPFLPI